MSTPPLPLAQVLGFEASDKRIDILRRIGQTGTISEAARQAGVSYKAAWQALETLTNLAGTPLVDKAVGGSGGGGAVLTDAGWHVLEAADRLAQVRQQLLSGWGTASPGRAALALRTSMRNQFPCTVAALRPQGGQVRVALELAPDALLHARITRESAQLLGLVRGLEVLALCKATAVQIGRSLTAAAGRNLLTGTVTRAGRAAQGGEMGLRLPGGVQWVGFAEAGHGLTVGEPALAAVDEAAVVIAQLA
jgi:molybdate transport system regulatory protein